MKLYSSILCALCVAFAGMMSSCINRENPELPPAKVLSEANDYLQITENPDGTSATVKATGTYTGKDGKLVIPKVFAEKRVSVVLINKAPGIKNLIIPDGVWRVELNELPDLAELELPGFGDFFMNAEIYNCPVLKKAKINEGITWAALEDYVAPPYYTDKTYPDWFFKLETISLPGSLGRISMFAGTKELELDKLDRVEGRDIDDHSVDTEPEEVTRERNFYGRPQWKTVILGEGIRSIDRKAFSHCANLEALKLPDSVHIVDRNAFDACPNLKLLSVIETCEIDDRAFDTCESRPRIQKRLPSPNYKGALMSAFLRAVNK